MKTKNLKITLKSKEIKKLLRDKLKRTVNYKSKLYQCKILKKCRTIKCTKKTKNKCSKKRKRTKKKGKGRKHLRNQSTKPEVKDLFLRGKGLSLITKQPYFRGSFLDFT